jgi:hypothetical protein
MIARRRTSIASGPDVGSERPRRGRDQCEPQMVADTIRAPKQTMKNAISPREIRA